MHVRNTVPLAPTNGTALATLNRQGGGRKMTNRAKATLESIAVYGMTLLVIVLGVFTACIQAFMPR